ncbi:Procollagen C-endopeptidase enhancer 2 [Takifugu flavidus]|uniref:Procollagen C-endopeptidase enhancer 2 n=1 Tax=Takifugu flavidus TaxID=433684 RepID=A0A5C6P8B3_9TELE|nr:Procollagen C-endopeptidase enhancer 2 [Takifugu flavidus]
MALVVALVLLASLYVSPTSPDSFPLSHCLRPSPASSLPLNIHLSPPGALSFLHVCFTSRARCFRMGGYIFWGLFLFLSLSLGWTRAQQSTNSRPVFHCGGDLVKESGFVGSEGFPNSYKPNSKCTWRITVPEGNVVKLSFRIFNLEADSQCRYDYLDVYNGLSNLVQKLGRFCGTFRPGTLISTTNTMMLEMVTDEETHSRGFLAYFSAVKPYADDQQFCGGKITKSQGELKTPNWPENKYPPGTSCSWLITMEPGMVIQVKFDKFLLEADIYCRYDYVAFFNGGEKDDSHLIGKYCGDQAPEPITSSGNVMLVQFVSDLSLTSDGFLAYYTSFPHGTEVPTSDRGAGSRPVPPKPDVRPSEPVRRPGNSGNSGQGRRVITTGQDRRVSGTGQDRRVSTPGQDRRVTGAGQGRRVSTTGQDRRVSTTGQDRRVSATGQDRRVSATGQDRREGQYHKHRQGRHNNRPGQEGQRHRPGESGRNHRAGQEGNHHRPGDGGGNYRARQEGHHHRPGEGGGNYRADKKDTTTDQEMGVGTTEQDKKDTTTDQERGVGTTEQDKKDTTTDQERGVGTTEQDKKETTTDQERGVGTTEQDKKDTTTDQERGVGTTEQDKKDTTTDQERGVGTTEQDKKDTTTDQDQRVSTTDQERGGSVPGPNGKRPAPVPQNPLCTKDCKRQGTIKSGFCASEFVITGTVTSLTNGPRGTLLVSVSIIKTYKAGRLTITQVGETMSVKLVSQCRKCPLLRRGGNYIIMGQVDEDGRGTLEPGSFTAPYKAPHHRLLMNINNQPC